MSLRVYLDEDFQSDARRNALVNAGFDVMTSTGAGMNGRSDIDQLQFAASVSRIILTHNQGDFFRIHGRIVKAGQHHAGICIVRRPDEFSPGEIVRRMLVLQDVFAQAGTRDQLLFLANFG